MCLILFAINSHPDYPLVLAANRDEFYGRATATAAPWEKQKGVYGGIDLEMGGSWLAISETGRFAAVTNYRDPSKLGQNWPKSRGQLVNDYVCVDLPSTDYLESLKQSRDHFSGYNLLFGQWRDHTENLKADRNRQLHYYSNISRTNEVLSSGIHGLSNHLLNTPWPKVQKGKAALEQAIHSSTLQVDDIMQIMQDTSTAPIATLPNTGLDTEAEQRVSPIHLKGEGQDYGTRCTTVLTIDRDNHVFLWEKSFSKKGHSSDVRFEFTITANS